MKETGNEICMQFIRRLIETGADHPKQTKISHIHCIYIKQYSRELAKDEKLDPKTRRSAPVRNLRISAQIIPKAHGTQIMEQLRQRSGHTYPRKCRQTEIP